MPTFTRPVLSIAAAFVAWQIAAEAAGSPLLIPPPAHVLRLAWTLIVGGELLVHAAASMQRLGVGLLVGIPFGALLGCAMGRFPLFDAFLDPYLRMANSIPAIALIPFSLLWFGVTEPARWALLVYIVTLTVALSARHGVREVPRIRLKAASSLGLTEWQLFIRVVVPSSLPAILAGVRTAIGIGVMVIVAAEMLGARSGLGYLLMEARQQYNVERMFVGIISLGCLGLVLDRTFQWVIEHRLPRWSSRRRVR